MVYNSINYNSNKNKNIYNFNTEQNYTGGVLLKLS